jgi:hypothetical protein
MSFVEKVEQLNQSISASLERAVSSLRRDLQDRLQASHQDLQRSIATFEPQLPGAFVAHADLAPEAARLRAEGRGAGFCELRDALAALDRARAQSEVLAALTTAAGRFASRAAVLLWRGGELRGWGGHGFGDAAAALRSLVLSPPAGSPWDVASAAAATESAPAGSAVRLSAADCALLCGQVEIPVPLAGWLVPLVLRDRVVALLYADQLAAADTPAQPSPAPGQELDGELLPALQSLAYVAALAIETLPFRQRAATATLAVPGAPATVAEPAAEAPPAVTPASPAAAEPAATSEATAAVTSERLTSAEDMASTPSGATTAAAPAADEVSRPDDSEPRRSWQPEPVAAPAEEAQRGPVVPFKVTPATLYDTPSVPVMQETAEIPRPAPLRPVGLQNESPYLERPAEHGDHGEGALAQHATVAPPATPAVPPTPSGPLGSTGIDTVLLPRGVLREAGGAGRRTSEMSEARLAAASAAAGNEDDETVQRPPRAPLHAAAGLWPAAAPEEGSAAAAPAESPLSAPAGIVERRPSRPSELASFPGGAGNLRAVPATTLSPAAPALPEEPALSALDAAATGALPAAADAPASPPAAPPGSQGFGAPEVRPPAGVQGPGWAFATTRLPAASGDEALHEEARRLARLLVSEIKLYNEEQVEAGRRNRDIYERLREDIDRSRQMYEERVEPRLLKSTDYFYQELVRILAAGDSKALGI